MTDYSLKIIIKTLNPIQNSFKSVKLGKYLNHFIYVEFEMYLIVEVTLS